ncbi:hypothetical protein CREGCYN_09600 [Synechococcus sp. M16CYN]
MFLFKPFCYISAAKIISLKLTVVLLTAMLIKSNLLRVKMSILGSLIGFIILIGGLISTGILTVVAGGVGAVAYASTQRQNL